MSDRLIDMVLNFGRLFDQEAGRPENLAAEAVRRGKRWLAGNSHRRAAVA